MKLYMHPVSTTCRPILFFAAEAGIALDPVIVDILTGEQYGPEFSAINPNNAVPVLEDDGFRLRESSAILKYLADKAGSPAYPKDLRSRAKVNEAMDWFNTSFYRSFGYDLCYRQILDPYKLPDEGAQRLVLEAAKAGAQRYMKVLDEHMLGANPWVCGKDITLADYLGSGMVSLGLAIGCSFDNYPNVRAWLDRLAARPDWKESNAALYGWADFLKGGSFVTL